ncbi:TonB-dependent receptor [Sphingomonas sp. DG1-23]|uniref:TonB-dependent receptor plug domain-containing protein n=1 Tax=Sphingomonas sp. DG1-23 TaxID=3068316 RepID=UPI00273DF930|nr:TonB-dependent receptor [Sphingomonas sp. DG1-23]MDP5278761.1 TonB-dependent receptor [Sphingomonas sp. DG1-23]
MIEKLNCSIVFSICASCSTWAVPHASAQETAKEKENPEIVVRATVPAVVQKDDRTVYNLDANLQAASGSVADVLTTLPSVSVDANGGVRVHGEGVVVLVDGRPAPALRGNLGAALQSMSASTIAQIEVITSPGAEFRSNAAAVINIVTKKPSGPETKGEISANLGTPHRRRNMSFNGSTGTGKWTFGTTLGFREDVRSDLIDVDLRTFDASGGDAARLTEHRSTFVPYRNLSGNLNADYAISDRGSLRISAEGALRDRPRRYTATTILSRRSDGLISTGLTKDAAEQDYDYYALTGEYNRTKLFGNDKLSARISYENHVTNRLSSDIITFREDPSPNSLLDQSWLQDGKVWKGSFDYRIDLSKVSQLKLGGEVENANDIINYGRTRTLSESGVVSAASTSARIRNRYSAAYLEYKTKIDDWSIRGGVRFETQSSNIRQDGPVLPVENSSDSWSPSLTISSDLDTNDSVAFAYSRRVNRPSADELAPIQLVVNTVTNVGNPRLKPETIDKFSVKYNHDFDIMSLSVEAYFNESKNEVLEHIILPDPDQPYLVSTFQNADESRKYGVDASLNIPLSSKLKVNLDADIFRGEMSLLINEDRYRIDQTSYILKADVTWSHSKKGQLQFSSQLYGNSLSSNGINDAYSSLNLSYSYQLARNLKIVANFTNISGTTEYGDIVRSKEFIRRTRLRVPGQVFFAGLKYKFGGGASVE